MARKKSKTLTDREVRIMDVVWTNKEVTVKDVTEALNRTERIAYNTVQTMLGILEDKGYVSHGKVGRAFVYHPVVSRREARSGALRHLLSNFFGGSSQALVQNLIADEDLDAAELEALRKMLDEPGNDHDAN